MNQTTRHRPYGQLRLIYSLAKPFDTISIDFVLGLQKLGDGSDCLLTITDKFSKRLALVADQSTFSATEWARRLLAAITDWGIPKAIISDCDPKFLSEICKGIFERLGVKLLHTTAYHPQADGQAEGSNQTVEIAFRYWLTEGNTD